MPTEAQGPQLRLFGPDEKFGAKPRKGFTRYVWYIVWRESGERKERATGIERVTGGDCEREQAEEALEAFLTGRRSERNARPNGPCDPSQYLIGDALKVYADEHAPTVAAPASVAYAIEPLVRFWGDKPVSTINKATCAFYGRHRAEEWDERQKTLKAAYVKREALRARRAGRDTVPPKPPRTLSPATPRKELGTLQAALNYCIEAGYLTSAPPVSLPEKGATRDRWLTRSEVGRLVRAARNVPKARHHLPLLILLGVYTAARREAICSLQWVPNTVGGHVDLDRGRIDYQGGARRTTKRRPEMKIPRRLVRFLTAAGRRTRQYVIEYQGNKLVNPNRAIQSAATAAGLGKVTMHTLKHTAITWLVSDGVPLWEVAQWCDTSEAMIRAHYGHHVPDRFKGIDRVHR